MFLGFGCEKEMWVHPVDWFVNLFRKKKKKKAKYGAFALALHWIIHFNSSVHGFHISKRIKLIGKTLMSTHKIDTKK